MISQGFFSRSIVRPANRYAANSVWITTDNYPVRILGPAQNPAYDYEVQNLVNYQTWECAQSDLAKYIGILMPAKPTLANLNLSTGQNKGPTKC